MWHGLEGASEGRRQTVQQTESHRPKSGCALVFVIGTQAHPFISFMIGYGCFHPATTEPSCYRDYVAHKA